MTGYLAQQIVPITPEVLAILEGRGFESEAFIQLNLGIGICRTNAGALAVPFLDGEKIESLKLLDPKSGATLKHLLPRSLPYNLNAARDSKLVDQPLIVVDDEAACWAALMAGFPRSIAIPAEQGEDL